MNRTHRTVTAALAAAILLPLGASASYLHRPDQASLETCLGAIEHRMPGARVEDTFHARIGDQQRISANVSHFAEGRWQPLRVTCETSRSGRTLVELGASPGRWVEAGEAAANRG
ncbi:MAG: hypothetical protein V2J02_08985 [Pseudomonadales bacterium]|jgi:hypothetical protein|nr:hypothetical protein [Pseudomonadales bacterium]